MGHPRSRARDADAVAQIWKVFLARHQPGANGSFVDGIERSIEYNRIVGIDYSRDKQALSARLSSTSPEFTRLTSSGDTAGKGMSVFSSIGQARADAPRVWRMISPICCKRNKMRSFSSYGNAASSCRRRCFAARAACRRRAGRSRPFSSQYRQHEMVTSTNLRQELPHPHYLLP